MSAYASQLVMSFLRFVFANGHIEIVIEKGKRIESNDWQSLKWG